MMCNWLVLKNVALPVELDELFIAPEPRVLVLLLGL